MLITLNEMQNDAEALGLMSQSYKQCAFLTETKKNFVEATLFFFFFDAKVSIAKKLPELNPNLSHSWRIKRAVMSGKA